MTTVTFSQLSEACWRELPPVRKRLAGRSGVDMLLADAILELEPERLEACRTADERLGYRDRLMHRVRCRRQAAALADGAEGSAALLFVLSVAAASVISWLVQRWLNHHFSSEQLDAWKQELSR